MKMEKLEEELNRLADDGWHVSVVYPYQFKEQLKACNIVTGAWEKS